MLFADMGIDDSRFGWAAQNVAVAEVPGNKIPNEDGFVAADQDAVIFYALAGERHPPSCLHLLRFDLAVCALAGGGEQAVALRAAEAVLCAREGVRGHGDLFPVVEGSGEFEADLVLIECVVHGFCFWFASLD